MRNYPVVFLWLICYIIGVLIGTPTNGYDRDELNYPNQWVDKSN